MLNYVLSLFTLCTQNVILKISFFSCSICYIIYFKGSQCQPTAAACSHTKKTTSSSASFHIMEQKTGI